MGKNVAQRLKESRGNTPINEVAAAIGISPSAMRMYESGHRIPRDDVKVRLAKFYNQSVEALFF